jgi:hypothetical protein
VLNLKVQPKEILQLNLPAPQLQAKRNPNPSTHSQHPSTLSSLSVTKPADHAAVAVVSVVVAEAVEADAVVHIDTALQELSKKGVPLSRQEARTELEMQQERQERQESRTRTTPVGQKAQTAGIHGLMPTAHTVEEVDDTAMDTRMDIMEDVVEAILSLPASHLRRLASLLKHPKESKKDRNRSKHDHADQPNLLTSKLLSAHSRTIRLRRQSVHSSKRRTNRPRRPIQQSHSHRPWTSFLRQPATSSTFHCQARRKKTWA